MKICLDDFVRASFRGYISDEHEIYDIVESVSLLKLSDFRCEPAKSLKNNLGKDVRLTYGELIHQK